MRKSILPGTIVLFAFLFLFPAYSLAAQSEDTLENIFKEFSGGETFSIGIQDSILMALENNPTLAIQRHEPEIALAAVEVERAEFDPELNVTTNISKEKVQRFLGSSPNPFALTTDRPQQSIGISETLPTGTTVSASAGIMGSISSLYTDQFTGNIDITISQALLRGFGMESNLASLRKAKIDVEISKAELKSVAENLISNIEKAYWNLYLLKEEISIHSDSLALAERQLDESFERVEVGKLAEIELAAVHAEVAARRESLIDAYSRYEKARLNFLYLLNPSGKDMWSMIPLTLDKPFVPDDSMDPVTVHEQLGLKYRSDLQQARLSLNKGELDVQQTKNGLLPRLDFFLSFGKTTYAQSFNDSIPDPQSPYYDMSAGLTFTMPLSNRRATAKYKQSVKSMEQMELAVGNMERLVQLDVRSAYVEAIKSREMIEATRVTRELQERNMEAEQEKFRVGKSTNYLVLKAQRDFTSSKLEEARVMVEYLNSLIDLYLMEGTLLDRRGIENLARDE